MSEVKVNKISPRTNCGTVQLGDSGDTITIPAGVTITNNGTAAGFGATGAASWDTTVKTSGFTAVSGVGYFVNTTAGAISVNLPAGVAGAVVAIKDYANTFDTNAVTLVQNGSDKIGGSAVNATLSTEGISCYISLCRCNTRLVSNRFRFTIRGTNSTICYSNRWNNYLLWRL
jgi:hypothetical protein